MKTYNRFIVASIVFYVCCSFVIGYLFNDTKIQSEHAYRVNVNQIMAKLQVDNFENVDVTTYESIDSIEYLDVTKFSQEAINMFYQVDNIYDTTIQPWYQQNTFKGYIKFYYQKQAHPIEHLLYYAQGGLFLLEISFVLFLLYMKNRIIKPFHRLSSMPYELAKGHFKKEVHIDKSRYFKDFLWGMSQLKDTLDISKKRQYELMKEKKQLLLLLSHDIKTPLNLIKLYNKALDEHIYQDEQTRSYATAQIEKKSQEIEQYVETIIASAKEDILDFDVKDEEFYMSDLVHQVLDVYREQCQIRNMECRIGAYENRLLKGDIHRAQEVIENLFENAFKYGDGQCIEVSFDEEEYHQLIHIRNSGVPLQPQEIHHIFESFFRGSNAQGEAGSGLGLYICKELMRKMNGAIYAVRYEDGMEFVLVFQ